MLTGRSSGQLLNVAHLAMTVRAIHDPSIMFGVAQDPSLYPAHKTDGLAPKSVYILHIKPDYRGWLKSSESPWEIPGI